MLLMRRTLIALTIPLLVLFASPLFASGEKEQAGGTGGTDEVYEFSYAWGPWNATERIPTDEQSEDPFYQYIAEEVGAVPQTTTWEWEGGSGYVQGLRLALAGGEEFDAIMPWNPSLARELVNQDIAIPLGDLLDEHGPNVRDAFTDEQWSQIRTSQGGTIHYLPQYQHKMSTRAGFIRKDWLERVGMDVPETKEELLEVYRAFKEQDANGNGDPNDEIPVSGRQGFRWFDDLFIMHGVSMFEGHPQWRWNEEEGIFESDQVSDEMFNAVKFIKRLYDEGLMDQTMPTQPNSEWTSKLNAGRIGHYFHLFAFVHTKSSFAFQNNDDPTGLDHWTVMPQPPQVEGMDRQNYYYPVVGRPYFMITKWADQPEKIMEWFDWGSSPEGNIYGQLGIPGEHWRRTDDGGIEVMEQVQRDYTFRVGFRRYVPDLFRRSPMGEVKVQMLEKTLPHLDDTQNMMMPPSVYEGHEDFAPSNATFYREALGNFITGEWELTRERWEEYKQEWYDRGGEIVTERATEWYKDFHGE
jgi:putative aldouronate transport system substrate-binding protein